VSSVSAKNGENVKLRRAALIAGFGYLMSPVPFAEFYVYPRLVIPGNSQQTSENIAAHASLFLTAIFCYLVTFIADVVVAWALYVLLVPVNKRLSLVAGLFRLVYAAIALFGLLNLVTAYRVLASADPAIRSAQLSSQVDLLLRSFRYDWSIGLLLFGIHLVLLGYLIFRSSYVPRVIGVLLAIDGLGWLIDTLRPYLYPKAHLGFISITFLGELVFMLWLLFRGSKIQHATA
jgi:hypothetical protein